MADQSVGELIAAQSVTPTDLFVLEQNGTAKKLTGQVLENWLVSFADGHGGIQSWVPLKKEGLVTTYRITLADQTHIDIDVVDGRGIESVKPTSTVGLVVTYTVTYNDGTTSTFNVTNGAKGDKGDNANVWIRYASQKPTASSHSFGEVADAWIGICSNHLETAPTDWQQYQWYQWKGEKGDPGEPATLVSSQITYQVGDSGTIIPSGTWVNSVPVVSQGKYLWTKTELRFNTGDPIVSYSVARMGIDGTGSVSSVAGVSPDATGNVTLTAADVGALSVSGGDVTGEIRMNGQPISGLNDPTEGTQAARKGYVDAAKTAANAYTDTSVRKAAPRNLLDNSDFTNPVNQRGFTKHAGDRIYSLDRWQIESPAGESTYNASEKHIALYPGALLAQAIPEKERFAGKIITIAVYDQNDNVHISSGKIEELPTGENEVRTYALNADDYFQIFIQAAQHLPSLYVYITNVYSSYWAVKRVALYEGEYTAETLPEYQPKGYGAELAECQRYYQIRSANNIAAVDMRPTMRLSSPTITSVTGGYAYSADL